jgi:type VI secretion system secreted protein VgrG
LPFISNERQSRRDQEHVFRWSPERRFRSGKFSLNHYDYLQPNADLKSDAEGSAGYSKSKMEIYDYPHKFKKKADGETYAKIRLQAEQAMDQRRYAEGDSISLFPGGLVTIEKHPQGSENKEYLILRASHSYASESYRSGNSGNEETYSGSYEFIPSDISFRAPLITPRPVVHGPQTAKVVCEEGKNEEIDVDEHGRILVHFFWARENKKAPENKQSCRVRVAQVWAGKTWGGQVIPRIGQEVIVEFLEGDPDRPLVTGAVYNGDNKFPFEMPVNKTQSGLKSDSSKGHGGYNELMFEDKKDSENIRMHAQKDYNVTILNTETVTIGEKFKSPTGSPSHKTTITNGDQVLEVVKGAILTSAKVKIELKVGPSKITIDPTGITLEAPLIKINP